MGYTLYVLCAESVDKCQNWLYIDLCRREKSISECFSAQLCIARLQSHDVRLVQSEYSANQRETVRVNAARWKRQDHIALSHAAVVYHFVLIYDACAVSREVVFVYRIEARHLRSLAADESGSCLYAALAYSRHYLLYLFRIVFAAGDVIKKEQRLCAHADDIVDTHRDAVDADGIMLVKHERELEFCTYSVSAAYQHRFADALEIELKQPAESSDLAHHSRDHSPGDVLLHEFDRFVARRYIDSRCFITV